MRIYHTSTHHRNSTYGSSWPPGLLVLLKIHLVPLGHPQPKQHPKSKESNSPIQFPIGTNDRGLPKNKTSLTTPSLTLALAPNPNCNPSSNPSVYVCVYTCICTWPHVVNPVCPLQCIVSSVLSHSTVHLYQITLEKLVSLQGWTFITLGLHCIIITCAWPPL